MPTQVTPRQLIAGALKKLNVIGGGAPISGEDLTDGFVVANDMLDAMKLERLLIYHTPRVVVPLQAAKAVYTIGFGGDINVDRPVFIADAGLVEDTSVPTPYERPIKVLADQDWARIGFKGVASTYVGAIYYDRSWSTEGLGRIHVQPVPENALTELALYIPAALQEFATITTPYTFPPGYRKMFKALLAVELAPEYGISAPPDVAAEAKRARMYIKRTNMKHPRLSFDSALPGRRAGKFDISTGGYFQGR